MMVDRTASRITGWSFGGVDASKIDRDELRKAVAQYVVGVAWVCTREEVARDIVSLQRHGAMWPKLLQREWIALIDESIAAGELEIRDGMIGPSVVTSIVQLELF